MWRFCPLQTVENSYSFYAQQPLEFHTCVYFVVASITTTGYGDVVAHSDTGQLVVICMLLWSFIQVMAASPAMPWAWAQRPCLGHGRL